jgi:hypothetical protein
MIRLTVINADLKVVLDELVLPQYPVIDLNSRFRFDWFDLVVFIPSATVPVHWQK